MTGPQPIETVQGRGIVVRGNDIDTDRIIPARFLRLLTFDDLGRHAFEDERAAQAGRHPFDDPSFRGASVLFVNRNFGSGSSREHAPQALRRWGIEAILGESFAEIFFGNCVTIGLPCLTLDPQDVARLQNLIQHEPQTSLRIDIASTLVVAGGREYQAGLPPGVRKSFLTGEWDALGLLLENPAEVRAARRRLPYLSGFDPSP